MSAVQDRWTLDADQLRAIEIGLRAKLRTRRISEAFIKRNLDDLVQDALAEYTQARERGDRISNPAGWIVHTASLRGIDAVRRELHEIDLPEDMLADAPDQSSPPSEEVAIEHLQVEELHRAIGRLSVSQRRALSLAFFEEKTTREGARDLGWSESTFRRRRDAAIQALRQRLGVTVPEIEIGLAAWLSLSAGQSRRVRIFEPLVSFGESVRTGLTGAGDKGRDLIARLLSSGGGEVTISAAGPAGRAAGICATAAVAACAATGVIGPGVGGIDLVDRDDDSKPQVRKEQAKKPNEREQSVFQSPPRESSSERGETVAKASKNPDSGKATSSVSAPEREATKQATTQFGVESQAAQEPASTAPPASPALSPTPASAPTPSQVANDQFGLP